MPTGSTASSRKGGRPYEGLSPERAAPGAAPTTDRGRLQEFGTVGYADPSIETLCRSAKVTPRYFYEFFASRERVLAAVSDRTSIEVLAGVSEAVHRAGTDDAAATIRAGTGSFFSRLFEDPRKARILCVESVGVSVEIEQSVAQFPSGDSLRNSVKFYPRSILRNTERPVDSMSAGVGGSASMVCRMARAVRAAPVTNSSSMRCAHHSPKPWGAPGRSAAIPASDSGRVNSAYRSP
jgi:AcrR family transcriptional regulator